MPYGGDPANDQSDAVRLLIGDTDNSDPIFSDAEIDYMISQTGSVILAAARLARAAAGKFARKVDKSVGDLKKSLSQMSQRYLDLAQELEDKASTGGGDLVLDFFVGGTSVSDKEARETDTDRVDPYFKRDQFSREPNSDNDDDPNWFPGGISR